MFKRPVATSMAGLVGSKATMAVRPLVQLPSPGAPMRMVKPVRLARLPAVARRAAETPPRFTSLTTAPVPGAAPSTVQVTSVTSPLKLITPSAAYTDDVIVALKARAVATAGKTLAFILFSISSY